MEKYAPKITKLLGKFLNHDQKSNSDRRWMLDKLNDKPNLQSILKKLQTQDIHILAILLNINGPYSIKKLPTEIGISQPSISRAIMRLDKYNLVKKVHPQDNSKEYVLILTENGEEIAKVHQQLQEEIINQLKNILSQYSTDNIKTFIDILKK